MKYIHLAFLLVIILVSGVFAQSGRKITPQPTTSTMAKSDADEFSESKPLSPRTMRATEHFPGIGDGSGSKPTSNQVSTAGTANSGSDDEVLRIETNLITVPVSVFDRNGLYITGLRQQDFKIFEDGVEQDVAYFGMTDKPFSVILLIDTSPSTAYKIEEIHQAAIAFVENLEPQDGVTVIEFARGIHVLTEATNDHQKIAEAIRKARFGDGTSLYDAVDFSLRKRLSKVEGRKAIVLFTDGVDTTSHHRYEQTVSEAEQSDSLIFPIYYNTFLQRFQDGGVLIARPTQNTGVGDSSEEYIHGKQYLEDLAAVTGGRVFRPESTPGGLSAAFEGIAEELRRQYSIGYIPRSEGKPGQRKRIKVRVNRPNLAIRARDSYIVGANAVAPNATPTPAKPNK